MTTPPILVSTSIQSNWRSHFKRLSELDSGEVPMLIDGILPGEGVTFIGSLSGVGKSWISLSMAKALRTGKPLFGYYKVPKVVPVAYLVPEMGSRSVRNRAEKLGIPDSEEFLFRTLKEGVMQLNSPHLKSMIETLKPVVFLDTAIRFMEGKEENSSSQNATGFVSAAFALVRYGARAVVCLHHSPKATKQAAHMTLENVLRGTGDFGAMCEVVWGVERERKKSAKGWDHDYEKESEDLTRLRVECLKGRDIPDVADPFIIQGRPYIDENHDFALLSRGGMNVTPAGRPATERIHDLLTMLAKDPTVSLRTISKKIGWSTNTIKQRAAGAGWRYDSEHGWVCKVEDYNDVPTDTAPWGS